MIVKLGSSLGGSKITFGKSRKKTFEIGCTMFPTKKVVRRPIHLPDTSMSVR